MRQSEIFRVVVVASIVALFLVPTIPGFGASSSVVPAHHGFKVTQTQASISPSTYGEKQVLSAITLPAGSPGPAAGLPGVKSTVVSFTFTGAQQTWTVPAGVTEIEVRLVGAGGERGVGANPGNGGELEFNLGVIPGSLVYVYVGGSNGWNGGAAGGSGPFPGGNGGGGTDLRIGGTAWNDIVADAGGGGGGGGNGGGFGGSGGGGNGSASYGGGGGGGTCSSGGAGGSSYGATGSTITGGAGGNGSNIGGAGGGGGGGGFYGGGGGGGTDSGGAGGGGGGSSCSIGTDDVFTTGYESGNGSAEIVYPPISVGAVTPTSPTIDNGQSIKLTANPSGGLLPYTYQWYTTASSQSSCSSGLTNITGATVPTLQVSPTAGTYYCYSATDGIGRANYSGTDFVAVSSTLSAGVVTPGVPSIDAGQSITLSSHVSGGTGVDTFQWYSGSTSPCTSNAAISGATGTTITVSPTANVDYCYTVSDSAYSPTTVTSAIDQVTVNPTLVARAVTPISPVLSPGQSVTLTAGVTGGTAPFAYQWYSGASANCSNDAPATGTQSATWQVTPSKSTFYCYSVSDASMGTPGESATSATDLVAVNSGGGGGPAISYFTASPSTMAIGGSLTFAVSVSGGTLPYTFAYSGLPAGCSNKNASSLTCTPTVAGNATVHVLVTDATGLNAQASTSVNVLPAGTVTLVVVTLSPNLDTGTVGQTLSFTASAIGSDGNTITSGVVFVWSLAPNSGGALSSGTGATVTVRLAQAGTFTLFVNATYNGITKGANAAITIQARSSASLGFLGLPGNDGYILIGVVVVAVAEAVLLLRKRSPPSPAKSSTKEKPEADKETEKGPLPEAEKKG